MKAAVGLTRVPYQAVYSPEVVTRPRDARELDMLTSQHDGRLTEETLRAWSEAEDGATFVFLEGGRPCAYAFVRASEVREAEFNEGQPHAYVWMVYDGS